MDDLAVERVLLAVELIPPGQAASYGDIGDIAGMGPRQVGQVMARYGSDVPWWRVTNAAGRLPADLTAKAIPHWDAEGTPRTTAGISLASGRTDLEVLRVLHAQKVAEVVAAHGTPLPAGIGAIATRALHTAGIDSLEAAAAYGRAGLEALPGVGPKAADLIAAAISQSRD